MDTNKLLGLGARGAGAYIGWKYLGDKLPGGPLVAALVGWIVADMLIDRVTED